MVFNRISLKWFCTTHSWTWVKNSQTNHLSTHFRREGRKYNSGWKQFFLILSFWANGNILFKQIWNISVLSSYTFFSCHWICFFFAQKCHAQHFTLQYCQVHIVSAYPDPVCRGQGPLLPTSYSAVKCSHQTGYFSPPCFPFIKYSHCWTGGGKH